MVERDQEIAGHALNAIERVSGGLARRRAFGEDDCGDGAGGGPIPAVGFSGRHVEVGEHREVAEVVKGDGIVQRVVDEMAVREPFVS